MSIHGFEVLGDRSVLPRVAERLGPIDQIVIAISAIGGRELHAIVELCRQYSPNVQVAPGLEELFLGKVSVNDLRDVQIEDLLGRESAQLSLDTGQLAGVPRRPDDPGHRRGRQHRLGAVLPDPQVPAEEARSCSAAARTASTPPSIACCRTPTASSSKR